MTPVKIEIIDPDPQADVRLFKDALEAVLSGEQVLCNYINVVFMTSDDLRTMKKQYFNLDVYTDVISFNLNDPDDPLEGELYLSFEQITENAGKFRTDPRSELYRVLIHGCLHLCGYEDDTTSQKTMMTSLENKYLTMLGIATD